MLVCGDEVYAQTWQVLTLKNCIEPLSYASTVCCMALVSFRPFCKNLGNLQEFFGQMDYRPPLAKNCPYAYVWTCSVMVAMSLKLKKIKFKVLFKKRAGVFYQV